MTPNLWIWTLISCWVSFAPASPDTVLLLWPLLTLLPWVFILWYIHVIIPRFYAWLLLVLLHCSLWSSLWLGPSLCSELPILLLLHSHSLRVDFTLISPNFISTFPHVGLELPSCFKWMSFRHLEVSRTGLISLLPHPLPHWLQHHTPGAPGKNLRIVLLFSCTSHLSLRSVESDSQTFLEFIPCFTAVF